MYQPEVHPPLVVFEQRSVDDREASISAGHPVFKDEDFALITPPGSKDRIERVVSEWFIHLREQVRAERFPPEWLDKLEKGYALWKEGKEVPLDGYDIRNWSVATPAQVKNMVQWGIRTVEQLSQANEETLGRLGMGGRALKAQAIDWLKNIDKSATAAETAALRQSNDELKLANERLFAQVKELEGRLKALEK